MEKQGKKKWGGNMKKRRLKTGKRESKKGRKRNTKGDKRRKVNGCWER